MQPRAMLFGALMLLAANSNAQSGLSFDDIPIEKDPMIEVDLGPEMLELLSEATKGEPRATRVALDGITNIRVRFYEGINENIQGVRNFVDATASRLDADGWNTVMRINDGDEHVRVYMKPDSDGKVAGVTLILTGGDGIDPDGGEAMFIDVAGVFEPAQLGRLASIEGMPGVIGVLGIVPGAHDADEDEQEN